MTDTERFKNLKQEQLQAVCRAKAIPLTVQRSIIMAALAMRKDHPTADDIYEDIKTKVSNISRTTVYRVLEAFVSLGIAQKVGSSAARARFDADADRHHHLECIRCGALIDLPHHHSYDIALPSLKEIQVLDYAIQFRGICARCSGAAA